MIGDYEEEKVSLLGDGVICNTVRSRFRASNRHQDVEKEKEDFEPSANYDEGFLKKYVANRSADKIVAVFVVAFDTKAGNVMEWFVPDDVDMEGVEFKALTSGSHNMTTDFVYFKKGALYGLACFERIEVANSDERGTRMKSVGILSTDHSRLHGHMTFLQQQVGHQLKHPNDYEQLIKFWNDNRALLGDSTALLVRGEAETRDRRVAASVFKSSHPFHTFSNFLKFYGPSVFALWKMALLGKRILFYSPPPIGVVCYRVYCTTELSHHSRTDRLQTSPKCQAYFYINVADIDDMQSENSYVACTTEKIFEAKPHLYDVYVDGIVINTTSPSLKDIVKVNDVDRERYKNLLNFRLNRAFTDDDDEDDDDDEEEEDEDESLMSFFRDQNDRILDVLLEVSQGSERQVTKEHMNRMNLHPQHDQSFIVELIEVFAIDVMPAVDNPCCPT